MTHQPYLAIKVVIIGDPVVRQRAIILKLPAVLDKTLLVNGDAFLVLDLGLEHFDGVAALDIERDGSRRRTEEDLAPYFLIFCCSCLLGCYTSP